MSAKLENKNVLLEFIRYSIVGGIAFLADTGTLVLMREVIFGGNKRSLYYYIAISAGFFVGITVNYLLSRFFVFTTKKQKEQSNSGRAFVIYVIVGVIGFFLTMFGMWLGKLIVGDRGLLYVLVKCFVSGVVLVWNYLGRKLLIYK